MPGGRLTAFDRDHIAEALSQGIGYAEIARQLSRPTSTVSREVQRNGGPCRYNARRAQRATERRARRRVRNTVGSEPATDGPLSDFLDDFAATIATTGLSPTAARVMVALYSSDTAAVTAAELVRHLGVSPATISASVTALEAQGLLRRERLPGTRHDTYRIGDDPWVRATLASAEQMATLVVAAHRGAAVFAARPAGPRFEAMGEFLEYVRNDMLASVQRWRRVLDERDA
ncbi:GbsR/MarR family transcriptional regulator [Nocardia vermiculata]|uniref:Helix-turn-helix domain-containing protein n=1 Tax=Nocardia vermiculata TaxID=257274 RepID=A0A846Y9D0_9NOCA|nr:MarR family transcriptional regulator [Nocardia vermiculata]NKY54404.1 helix-turn-helix domain-containing protein [Nocardia vermiculata]